MSSGPDLHFYQVSSKYSKGYSSYRADKKFLMPAPMLTPMGSVPKTICSPPLFGSRAGGGGGGGGGDIIRPLAKEEMFKGFYFLALAAILFSRAELF